MSITALLQSTSGRGLYFQDMIKPLLPPKDLFSTVNGDAFTGRAVINTMNNHTISQIVGIGFDVLARVLIASKALEWHEFYSSLGIPSIPDARACIKDRLDSKSENDFLYYLSVLYVFINKRSFVVNEEVAAACCFISSVEQLGHTDFFDEHINPKNRQPICVQSCVMYDVMLLGKAFVEGFLNTQVYRDSKVIISPRFLPEVSGIGGIADAIVDGFLVDFKTTLKYVYNWRDVAQIWCYYIFSEMSIEQNSADVLEDVAINTIGWYHARYMKTTVLDLFNVNDRLRDQTIAALNKFRFYYPLNSRIET